MKPWMSVLNLKFELIPLVTLELGVLECLNLECLNRNINIKHAIDSSKHFGSQVSDGYPLGYFLLRVKN